MTLQTALTSLVGLCLTSPLIAQTPDRSPPPADPSDGSAARVDALDRPGQIAVHTRAAPSPVQAMLRRHVEGAKWDETHFGEVLRWFRGQATQHGKVNILARWRALAAQGIDQQTPVTLELDDLTVGEILDELLDQLSGLDPLVYVVRGNILKVTTKSDMRRRLYTRSYDIATILASARASRVKPGIVIGQQTRLGAANANPGGGVGGSGLPVEMGTSLFGEFEQDEDDDAPARQDEVVVEFLTWIRTTVEPDTWAINGGPGTLFVMDGLLTVRTSADVHQILSGPLRLGP